MSAKNINKRRLYRGKTMEETEYFEEDTWVYGYLFIFTPKKAGDETEYYIHPGAFNVSMAECLGDVSVRVYPDSVGQCIDARDSKNIDMFENDIIKVLDMPEDNPLLSNYPLKYIDGAFRLAYFKHPFYDLKQNKDNLLVIGNTFDNKDLLYPAWFNKE